MRWRVKVYLVGGGAPFASSASPVRISKSSREIQTRVLDSTCYDGEDQGRHYRLKSLNNFHSTLKDLIRQAKGIIAGLIREAYSHPEHQSLATADARHGAHNPSLIFSTIPSTSHSFRQHSRSGPRRYLHTANPASPVSEF